MLKIKDNVDMNIFIEKKGYIYGVNGDKEIIDLSENKWVSKVFNMPEK